MLTTLSTVRAKLFPNKKSVAKGDSVAKGEKDKKRRDDDDDRGGPPTATAVVTFLFRGTGRGPALAS